MNKEGLSRREFFKITGAIAGMVVLEGCGVSIEPTPTPEPSSVPDKNPPATQEQIDFVTYHSVDPYQMVVTKLEGQTRLVGLGETHRHLNEELFAADLIEKSAKEKRIQFLALEIIDEHQQYIDEFLSEGIIHTGLSEDLANHKEGYRKILDIARKYGLTIICADSRRTPNRDAFMADTIGNFMYEHPDEKGIFYAGIVHIARRNHPLSDRLNDRYYAVLQIDKEDANDTLFDAMQKSGVKKIVGIDNLGQTPFRYAPYGYFASERTVYAFAFDAAIIHPPT